MNVKVTAAAMLIDHVARLMEAGKMDNESALDAIDAVWSEAEVDGTTKAITALLMDMALRPASKTIQA